jgi:hypothetical protein
MARRNPKDPNEVIPILLFWPHTTMSAYLRAAPDKVWEQLRSYLGDIPDYTRGTNVYGQPKSTYALQFRERGPEPHIGRSIEILVPRRLVGSVLDDWEPGRRDLAYDQHRAFSRWARDAERKLQDRGLLCRSRR